MIAVYFSVKLTESRNSWLSAILVKLSGKLNVGEPRIRQRFIDIQNTSTSGTRKNTTTITAVGAA